jgi:phosphoribosylamine--glycine ligase
VVNVGGRVLAVVGTGADLEAARSVAYAGIAEISLVGSLYRRDIAQSAARSAATSAR